MSAQYGRFVSAAGWHTFIQMPRRRMTLLAVFAAYLPVLIPLAIWMTLDLFFNPDGDAVFVRLAQLVYVSALCPLLALFYGGMLIGEDVESNTFIYVLTRPIPRSAWVIGKFLGYWAGASIMLVGSLALTFLVCTGLHEFPINGANLRLFAEFAFPVIMGLGGYGAVTLFLGAVTKRPMIWGIFLFFLWQRVALMLPGYVDFFTVEKYVSALLPEVAGMPTLIEMAVRALGVERMLLEVTPLQGALTLVGIMTVFLALSTWAVRTREYTAAQAAGG